jgi:hypothetical protein
VEITSNDHCDQKTHRWTIVDKRRFWGRIEKSCPRKFALSSMVERIWPLSKCARSFWSAR